MRRVKVYVGSDLLDALGQFTKFILWALSNQYNCEQIADAIDLGKTIVEDELAYLLRIGFIELQDGEYILTGAGYGYINLINLEKSFNSGKEAYLNCFTGEISNVNPMAFIGEEDGGNYLPRKVSNLLIQNRDYPPLQTYIEAEYGDYFADLSQEFKESLYFYLYPLEIKDKMYLEFFLPEIPKIDEHFQDADERTVLLERKLENVYFLYENEKIQKYRDCIDMLKKLHEFDSSLLSPVADDILHYADEERIVYRDENPQIFDTSTGIRLMPGVGKSSADAPDIKDYPKVSISPQRPLFEEYVEHRGILYKCTLEKQDIIDSPVYQKVPFSLFKEVCTDK